MQSSVQALRGKMVDHLSEFEDVWEAIGSRDCSRLAYERAVVHSGNASKPVSIVGSVSFVGSTGRLRQYGVLGATTAAYLHLGAGDVGERLFERLRHCDLPTTALVE